MEMKIYKIKVNHCTIKLKDIQEIYCNDGVKREVNCFHVWELTKSRKSVRVVFCMNNMAETELTKTICFNNGVMSIKVNGEKYKIGKYEEAQL